MTHHDSCSYERQNGAAALLLKNISYKLYSYSPIVQYGKGS